ncbi:GNAT family N-acetyltransferase [Microlunatus capsulatus]|uniref:RimJ/RimL family protein N-acetyltransferase n=1 Tax=Microlunatus capsulatus TaxID=99117 RepID=A0ABS4Z547_9ACTN|nr:GNAT family protein [Microlunatus capsulatus]MBP2416084.1 RimJ/RimL family protein N-acetyltransferase [Microlunatus capsulatus]
MPPPPPPPAAPDADDPPVELVRLTAVPLADVTALLAEPRNARHLPLARGAVTAGSTAAWVRGKDALWAADGYGPWAILLDGAFAGWGGFQREDHGPDLALVLRPECWGAGAIVTRVLLRRGFDDLGFTAVTTALPRTRNPDRAVARLGFEPAGETAFDQVPFRLYRLTRERWRQVDRAG